jgi:hypothetical protein
MKHRNALVAVAAVFGAWVILSAQGFEIVGLYPTSQMEFGSYLAIACLAVWAALEILARLLATRAPACTECGYSMAGVRCPECGHPAGSAVAQPNPPRPNARQATQRDPAQGGQTQK